MGKIHILPESLRNQIAAGEVVERPASIVKELVENAIDAGATEINIEIDGGGIEKIGVRDNGVGMDEADALMALKRSATSKISTSDDLFSLSTFGFRGEALASMTSVSHLELTTKQKGTPYAVRIHGEHSGEIQHIGAPDGTEILVTDLFAAVPARRKFLKSESTENSHIVLVVENFALAHPHISFRLEMGKKVFLDASLSDSSLSRVQNIFGKEFAENLFPLHFLGETLNISGFVSHPHVHRKNRKSQRIFVNGRPVSDRIIFAAISEAYKSLVPHGMHPDVILFLKIAPDLVDVNVHPRKSEVKFLKEREVFSAVKGAIESALNSRKEESESNERTSFFPSHSPLSQSQNFSGKKTFSSQNFQKPSSQKIQAAMAFSKSFLQEKRSDEDHHLGERKIIGQIRNSFVLLEEDEGIIIVDQHAAHERVRYEKLMKDLRGKTPQSQKLLVPQILELSPQEKSVLEEYEEVFENLGFEIQDFSEKEAALFSVPVGTEKVDFRENLKNLLHDLEGYEPEMGKAVTSPAQRIATFAACRGAVKFGDPLTLPEMEKLIQSLDDCEAFYSCAHGRPIAMKIPFAEIERECGR
ncbi:DNA mismatch repair endonuclease MutL [Candidatus Peregrinibacteria bacterium]|nr:DNA mismatch repair endonuclease MutL [Candidatus Peregrinibacteria bacterium]